MALGVRPWGCLFFSFWALFIISVGVQGLLTVIAPAFTEAAVLGDTSDGLQARWQIILFGYVATLFLTMVWAEQIGAGPFAASMKTDGNWLVVGIIGSPLILIASGVLMSMLFSGGDPNWQLRNSEDAAAFSDEATAGLAFVFALVFLAPILEEIAYRGIGLGCLLSRGWDAWGSAFLVTILFTLAHTHYTPAALVPVFLTGLFFSWLRIRSGSLAPSMAGHIAANASIMFL